MNLHFCIVQVVDVSNFSKPLKIKLRRRNAGVMQAFVLQWVMSVSVRSSTLSNCTTEHTVALNAQNKQSHTHTRHTRAHIAPLCMCACICMTDTHSCTHTHTHTHTLTTLSSCLIGRLISHLLSRGADREIVVIVEHLCTHEHTHTHTPPSIPNSPTHTHIHKRTPWPPPPSYIHFQAFWVQQHSSLLIDCHNGWRD